MRIFRFSKAISVGRGVKVFLNLQGGVTRGAVPDLAHHEVSVRKLQNIIEKQRKTLEKLMQRDKKRNFKQTSQLRQQKQEIFRLKNELTAMTQLVEDAQALPPASQPSGELDIGALPDFVVIGAQRCGTSRFYSLLSQHPNVERAAIKEVHYFDRAERFAKGTEWYRRCFPAPTWKDGQRSITGEATPMYLADPRVPERMAQVIPEARLIVLLRNPVDRAYSHYHLAVRRGHETRSFEEAIEKEQAWLFGEQERSSEHQSSVRNKQFSGPLARGIYVDQLQRWRQFFSDEQMLVIASEDFYEHTEDTIKLVQDFLGLPYRNPDLKPHKTGYRYEPMNPVTRQRLEAAFEPHNQRLYEFLGVDFGWGSRTLNSSS